MCESLLVGLACLRQEEELTLRYFAPSRYIAVGSSTKSKAVGVGRREASNAREWKLEALADLCEDYAFDNAVSVR